MPMYYYHFISAIIPILHTEYKPKWVDGITVDWYNFKRSYSWRVITLKFQRIHGWNGCGVLCKCWPGWGELLLRLHSLATLIFMSIAVVDFLVKRETTTQLSYSKLGFSLSNGVARRGVREQTSTDLHSIIPWMPTGFPYFSQELIYGRRKIQLFNVMKHM